VAVWDWQWLADSSCLGAGCGSCFWPPCLHTHHVHKSYSQNHSKTPQNTSKTPQNHLKTTKNTPKHLKNTPKHLKNTSKTLNFHPKHLKNTPKHPPNPQQTHPGAVTEKAKPATATATPAATATARRQVPEKLELDGTKWKVEGFKGRKDLEIVVENPKQVL
jgi:hypothetical protein